MKGTVGGREEGCMLTRVGACVCALLSFSLPKLCELSLSRARARALSLSLSLSLSSSPSLFIHACIRAYTCVYPYTYARIVSLSSLFLSLSLSHSMWR